MSHRVTETALVFWYFCIKRWRIGMRMLQNYQSGILMVLVLDRQQGKTVTSIWDQRLFTKTRSEGNRTYWFCVKHGPGTKNRKVSSLSVRLYFWWCRVSTHMHRVFQAKSTLFSALILNTPSHDGYVMPSLYIFKRQKRQVKCVHCNNEKIVWNSTFLFISFPSSEVFCSSKMLHMNSLQWNIPCNSKWIRHQQSLAVSVLCVFTWSTALTIQFRNCGYIGVDVPSQIRTLV